MTLLAFPRTFRRFCSNSLKVAVVEMPQARTAAVAWVVRVGSRDELPRLAGISHFVEHLKFRGCERYPDEAALQARFASLGALQNGQTDQETTCFHLEVLPDQVEGALETLGEMACSATFHGMEVERRVVLDELGLRLDPAGMPWELPLVMMQTLWPNHPFGQPVIGSPAALQAATVADCRAHLARFYTADNSVLVVAGRVDPEQVFAAVERHFARLPRAEAPRRRPPPPPSPRRLRRFPMGHERTQACYAFTRPVGSAREFITLELLMAILGPVGQGRLQRSLRSKAGLAYAFHASMLSLAETAVLLIQLDVAEGRLLQGTVEVLGHLLELRDRGPGEAEVECAKRYLLTTLGALYNQPTATAVTFGRQALDPTWVSPDEAVRLTEALTPADVHRAAQGLFVPGSGHLVARADAATDCDLAWARWTKALG